GGRRGRCDLPGARRLGPPGELPARAARGERGLRLQGGRPDVSRSEELFARAKAVLPGGVNSPVRAFRAVGGTRFFVARAAGSREPRPNAASSSSSKGATTGTPTAS